MGRKAQFREAWGMNQKTLLRLLAALGEADLTASYALRSRNVRQVLVHIHNMRLHWLAALADNPPTINRLKSREAHTVAELKKALEASSEAISAWLSEIATRDKVNVFGHSPITMLGFMHAHEAQHRGQIIIALRLSGRPLPRETIDSLWDWT